MNSSPEQAIYNEKELMESMAPSLTGTWQLLTVLTIEGEDSLVLDYTDGVKGIKMLNETRFSFFLARSSTWSRFFCAVCVRRRR